MYDSIQPVSKTKHRAMHEQSLIAQNKKLVNQNNKLRIALEGIKSLDGWAQVIRDRREEEFGFKQCSDNEREVIARAFEHAAYLAKEGLKENE